MSINHVMEPDQQSIQAWLAHYPLFAQFSEKEIAELAPLFTTQHFHKGDIIVAEETIVDSIYLIIQGRAEVRQGDQPFAILNPGDSIGLSQTGFFSSTGLRTATVIALEKLSTIKINIEQFHAFLNSYSHANQAILDNANILLRMRFLKGAVPFTELIIDKLYELAKQITEIQLSQGSVLFHQGDQGDCCYLIRQGSIEISVQTQHEKKVIAELDSPAIFGEAALLLDMPRNATARALQDTALLVLNKTLFLDLVGSEKSVAISLMRIQRARSRPIRLPEIEKYVQKTSDGEEVITLKHPQLGKYYRLSQYGVFIWDQLDGSNDLSNISLAFYEQFGVFDPSIISNLIYNLHQSGFVRLDKKELTQDQTQLSFFTRTLFKLQNILEAKWAFGRVDAWIDRSYQRFFWPLFTHFSQFIFILIIFFGFGFFIYHFSGAAHLLSVSPNKWSLILISYLGLIATIILHELAHAYATKSFGRQVHAFGVGWYWLGPIAFCDTSDMWLANKWQRIIVDLAGVYLNLIFAGLAGLGMALTEDHASLYICLWFFAFGNYLITIANLSPSLEFDGYYALMDFLNKPNLRESAIQWIGEQFFNKTPSTLSFSTSIKIHREEAIYWLVTLLYIILMQILIPYLLLIYVFKGVFGINNPLLDAILLGIAMFISGIIIWLQMQQK